MDAGPRENESLSDYYSRIADMVGSLRQVCVAEGDRRSSLLISPGALTEAIRAELRWLTSHIDPLSNVFADPGARHLSASEIGS